MKKNFGTNLKNASAAIGACIIIGIVLAALSIQFYDTTTKVIIGISSSVLVFLFTIAFYTAGELLNVQQQILDKLNHVNAEEEPEKNEPDKQE